MGRNKYPEETVAKILDAALELFCAQGYEGTSIQDIVDRLDGMTKGAVYHHFKSKEEIFNAAFDRAMAPIVEHRRSMLGIGNMTGAQSSSDCTHPSLLFHKLSYGHACILRRIRRKVRVYWRCSTRARLTSRPMAVSCQ